MEKRPFHAGYIDGLRAIAVLSVIAYHLNDKWLPGGFAGVDVFFVISGFVVSMSVSGLGNISFKQFLAYFYARRLVRITPALVVVLLATFIASALLIPQAWLSQSNQRTGLFAFVGLSNFILSSNTGNYFSPVAEFNPFTHTWSLAIEEQFYVIFPWLFIFWLRGSRRLSVALFASALVVSLVCAVWLGRTNETRAFYMIFSRFWELGVGVLTCQIMLLRGHSFDDESPYSRWRAIATDIGLVALVIGLIVARPQAAPFPACVIPVVATAGILALLHGRKGGITHRLLTLQPMRFVGKISYSLYLWHWPIFVLFRWTTGLDQPEWQVAAIALTAVSAVLSFYLVEQPPRRAARYAKKTGMIAAGLALIVSGGAISTAIAANQSSLSLSTVSRHMDEWYPEGPKVAHAPNGCNASTSTRNFDGGLVYSHQRDGCTAPTTFDHTIFVLGDSHAMAYTGMLKQFAARTGANVVTYTVGGCPFISLQPYPPGRAEACKRFTDASMKDLLPRIKPGDVVFLASLRVPRMVDQWAFFGVSSARDAISNDEGRQARDQGVQNAIPLLRAITDRGARVVFEAPTPMLESIPYRCADWFNEHNPICAQGLSVSRELLHELRAPVLTSYATIERAVPNVTVWDPEPTICPGATCQAYRNGKPLLFDGDHLSYYSNMLLLPSFSNFVMGSSG